MKINPKKFALCFWMLLITGGITAYLFFPEKINLLFLASVSEGYYLSLSIYFILISVRGLTLIPSTPLLLAGTLFFDPVELFIVNMAGILTSSTLVYYFSKYMGFDEYFEIKYGKYVKKIRNGLKDKELPIIVGWSFFPLVPTDLIVYIGSTLSISILKCLFGVFVGEAVLNIFYIISANIILQP